MRKRIVAALLSLVMIISLFPVLPVHADDTETEIATGLTDGTYTDNTAVGSESYEYTITGSDGTVYTLTSYGFTGETGNKVNGAANGYYKLLENNETFVEGRYLIVGAHSGNYNTYHKAISVTDSALSYTDISGLITTENIVTIADESAVKYIWEIKATDEGYTIQNINTQDYLTITDTNSTEGAGLSTSAFVMTAIQANNNVSNAWAIGTSVDGTMGYLNNRSEAKIGTYTDADGGSALFLFQYKTPGYYVDTSGLEALVHQLNPTNNYLKEADYTAASWSDFTTALAAAQTAIANEVGKEYATEDEANAALAVVDQAYANLYNFTMKLDVNVATNADTGVVTAGQEAIPAVVWKRTLESRTDKGEVVTDLQTIDPSDTSYGTIEWSFDRIAGLTTDPTMLLWDYGVDGAWYGFPDVAEYQDVVPALRASTWREWENDNGWTHSSVRLISGEFIWPQGFDLDDTAIIESAEDADYQGIYDYINANADLKAEFAGDKVLPINDDFYFFIRKDGETLTSANYMDHMVFWSGTSGKGIWSTTYNSNNDWGRTVPAVYRGQNALPAFYQIVPNVGHLSGTQATTEGDSTLFAQMEHTDKWYTLADTNALMSTLRNLYGTVAAGEKFYIDVYCFDNDGVGGMDPLEVKLIKNAETTATVQVNYYLNAVTDTTDTAHYLGTSYLTGQTVGAQLYLNAGTGVGQLNYRKAVAAAKAGTAVSNGVQVDAPFIVQEGNNVINVLYTEGWPMTHYTFDFGVTNTYAHKATLPEGATVTGYSFENVTNGTLALPNSSSSATFTYTPANSLGKYISATLVTNYTAPGVDKGVSKESIFIYPASNVLYEENFMTPVSSSYWSKVGTVDASVVSDNGDTVYGYTASYNQSTGESGYYSVTVDNDDTTAAPRFTDDLAFSFYGTGFDLIGTCGPATGTLMVRLNDGNGKYVKGYVVDTAFVDGNYGTIYQVPIVHEEDLPEGSYSVTVRGAYIDYAPSTSTMSTFGMGGGGSDAINDIYDLMYSMGLSDSDVDEVEFINMDKLLGASTYSTDGSTETTATTTPTSMTLEIDGFRAYRLANNAHYVAAEKDMIYTNVMEGGITGQLAAYIEGTSSTTVNVTEYEGKGGPQNEIYLAPNSAVAFSLTGATKAQISARFVGGTGSAANTNAVMGINTTVNTHTIAHNTEMYYEITPNNGVVVIGNISGGLLALGNIKSDVALTAISTSQLEEAKVMMLRMMRPTAAPEETTETTAPEEATTETTTAVETPTETTAPVEKPTETTAPVEKPTETTAPAEKPTETTAPVEKPTETTAPAETPTETTAPVETPSETTAPVETTPETTVPEETEEEVFKPERMDVDMDVKDKKRNRQFTLTVKTSKDVSYITVNGARVDASKELNRGKNKDTEKVFTFSVSMANSSALTFDVVAYNSAGVASDVVTVGDVKSRTETFIPSRFKGTMDMKASRSAQINITVNTSSDVAYITVNGIRVDRFTKKNGQRVFKYIEATSIREAFSYEVLAYNNDGVVSNALMLTN